MNFLSTEKYYPKISIFLILTFTLSSIFWFFADKSQNYYLYITGLMWCPGISALLVSSLFKDKFSKFKFRWKNTKLIILSYFFPLIYFSLSYSLLWLFGLGDIDFEQIDKVTRKLGMTSNLIGVLSYVILITLFGVGSRLFAAIGEEIGWRGFLLNNLLIKYKPLQASLIVGVIWAIWHYPLFGLPETGSNFIAALLPIINFTLMVVALSIIYTKFWLITDSIWASFMLHASHNLFLQTIFNLFTKWNDKTDLYADETGLLLMIILVIIAILIARNINSSKINNTIIQNI